MCLQKERYELSDEVIRKYAERSRRTKCLTFAFGNFFGTMLMFALVEEIGGLPAGKKVEERHDGNGQSVLCPELAAHGILYLSDYSVDCSLQKWL